MRPWPVAVIKDPLNFLASLLICKEACKRGIIPSFLAIFLSSSYILPIEVFPVVSI